MLTGSASESERMWPDVHLDAQAEHAMFRVAQEALANSVKHAAAREITVRLAKADGLATMLIRDNGRGFDPASAGEKHGMGLTFMRDRVKELGGSFRLDSAPGAGTVVEVCLPSAATAEAVQ
jgi:two-component system, NarL family, sensor histidine kinase LiaS